MSPSIIERIQARIELFRLEQRYTRRRHRRSTFHSNAIYVDGEYIYNTPNTTGSSTGTNASAPANRAAAASAAAPPPFVPSPDDRLDHHMTTTSSLPAARRVSDDDRLPGLEDPPFSAHAAKTHSTGGMNFLRKSSAPAYPNGSNSTNKRHSVAFGTLPGFGPSGSGSVSGSGSNFSKRMSIGSFR